MRYLLIALTATIALAGCGGSADATDNDVAVCQKQAADLAATRSVIDKWAGPAFNFAPGEEQKMFQQVGDGISALTGYIPDDPKLATAVDRARDGLQGFYDDWTSDRVLDGSGQSVDTAQAGLKALDAACGNLGL